MTAALSLSARPRRLAKFPRGLLLAGAVLVTVLVAVALLAPLVTGSDPNRQNLNAVLLHPSAAHLFGTDQLGRDVLTRVLYAARTDLRLGVIAVALPFVLGSALGVLAGYVGGLVDTVISRVIDVVIAFPFYVLAIALVYVLGRGETSIYIAFTAVGWVSYARIVRAQVLILRDQDFILAAQLGGIGSRRVMFVHLLRNVSTQAVVYAMSDVVLSVQAIVTLGYLGLGVEPPTAEWGSMISDGQQQITTLPLLVAAPGLAIVFTGMAFSLVGDGLAHKWRIR